MNPTRIRLLRATALASAAALGMVPIAAAASADAAPAEKKAKAPSEKTTLPLCSPTAPTLASPQFYGAKVTVGFFDGVKPFPAVNKAKAGGTQELEFRVEDSGAGCVMSDVNVGYLAVVHVDCETLDPLDYLDNAPSVFEVREKHFSAKWAVPAGKGQCYTVRNADVMALYRTK